MSNARDPLRLTANDLYSPRVDAFLEEQDALQRGAQDVEPQPLILRILYSSYFYLSIASGLGGFTAWVILEPFYDDSVIAREQGFNLAGFLLFPTVVGFIGLFLGAAEGIMCRNPRARPICALVGVGVGFGGGIVGLVAASITFVIANIVVAASRRTYNRGRCPPASPCSS